MLARFSSSCSIRALICAGVLRAGWCCPRKRSPARSGRRGPSLRCRPAVSILGRGWPELVPVVVVVAFPELPAAHPGRPMSTLQRGCRDVPPAVHVSATIRALRTPAAGHRGAGCRSRGRVRHRRTRRQLGPPRRLRGIPGRAGRGLPAGMGAPLPPDGTDWSAISSGGSSSPRSSPTSNWSPAPLTSTTSSTSGNPTSSCTRWRSWRRRWSAPPAPCAMST